MTPQTHCEPCATSGETNPAILRIDAVAVCRAHARGDGSAVRPGFEQEASAPVSEIPVSSTFNPSVVLGRRSFCACCPQELARNNSTGICRECKRRLVIDRQPTPKQLLHKCSKDFVAAVLQVVSDAFGVAADDIASRGNQPFRVIPRQAAMLLLREYSTASYSVISDRMGLKMHHTSVMDSIEVARKRLATDKEFSMAYTSAERHLRGMAPEPLVHPTINVRDCLRWHSHDLRGMFFDGERPMPPGEAHQYLIDQLASGRKFLPTHGVECNGFSYETGCPGHDRAEG